MRHIQTFILVLLSPFILGAATPGGDISVVGGAFCETGLIVDAERSVDRLFAEADKIAGRSQECPSACAPAINQADFCAYGDQLALSDVAFGSIAGSAVDASLLFDTAAASGQHVLVTLSQQLTLFSNEAIDVLETTSAAVEAARAGTSAALPDETRWNLVARDLADFHDALTLLDSLGLASGDVASLTGNLAAAISVLERERDALHKAIDGAAVLEPAEADRLTDVLSNARQALGLVKAQISQSAERAESEMGTAVNTEANANPPATALSTDYQDAAACLTSLSLTLMTGREALIETKRILQDCRPLNDCRITPMPKSFSLERILSREEEAAKQSFAVTSSMCQ
eukprot:s1_g913.t1